MSQTQPPFGVTLHLELLPSIREAFDPPDQEMVLATNLLTGRRIRAALNPLMALFEKHRQGAPLSGELAERAADADILCPLEAANQPNSVIKELERCCFGYLGGQSDGWPLQQKLERCRERFLAHVEAPQLVEKLKRPTLAHHQTYDQEGHYLWHDPQRLVSTMFETVSSFLQIERPDAVFDFDTNFLRATVGRPGALLEYEQQPCLVATTLQRMRLAQREGASPFLVLGDDDLISVALTSHPEILSDVDVFELDSRLLNFLAPRTRAKIHARDLTTGLPPEFHGLYRTVFTDPMYMADGMHHFIGCCRQGLSSQQGARVFLTTCPEQLQDPARLWRSFEEHGLKVVKQHRNFSRYRFPQTPRRATLDGLIQMGLPPSLCYTLLSVPYLYADMFELSLGALAARHVSGEDRSGVAD